MSTNDVTVWYIKKGFTHNVPKKEVCLSAKVILLKSTPVVNTGISHIAPDSLFNECQKQKKKNTNSHCPRTKVDIWV